MKRALAWLLSRRISIHGPERGRSEEALRHSREGYALAMAAAQDGYWDWDMVTGAYYMSPRNYEIYGFPPGTKFTSRDEFIASPYLPEGSDEWVKATADLYAGTGTRVSMESRVIVRGKERWFHRNGICTRDPSGKPIRWTVSVRDVTDRKRAEEALRLSAERFSLALEATEEGHFDLDLDTDDVFISERLNEIHGFASGTRVLKRDEYFKDVRFYRDEDREAYNAAVLPAEADGGPDLYECEFRILRTSGEMRWLRTRGKVTRDADGRARRRTGVVADVTNRKHSEEALRHSEQGYELAMEAAQDAHWDWDMVTGEYYLSPRVHQIYGVPVGTVVRTRADVLNLLPYAPEVNELWTRATAELFAGTGDRLSMEQPVVVRGETRWVLRTGVCKRDAAGKPIRWSGSARDVTERRVATDELRESEGRFRALTELSSDWYWRQDETLRFTYSSAATNPPEEYPGGSSVGKTRQEFPGIVPLSSSWAEHEAILAARKPFRDFEYSRPAEDGTIHYISISGAPIFDEHGRFKGYHGVGRSITERKRAAEALRQSEERYALAVAGSDDGVWDLDFDARHVFISARSRELMGMLPGPEMMSWEEWSTSLPLHPDDLPRRTAAFQAHLEGKTPAYIGEFRLRQLDGTYRWRRLRGLCVRSADGKPSRMAGSISDIDDRRRAEEALRQSEQGYELAMEAARDAHWDWDMVTGEHYLSPRIDQVFGVPVGTKGRTRAEALQLLPYAPEENERWIRATAELFAGTDDRLSMEQPITVRGETRWVLRTGVCKRDASGKPIRWSGSARDVTDRRRAEEALRLSEERYRLALDASGEGHFDIDVTTDSLYSSDRMLYEIFGYPPGTRFQTRPDFMQQFPFHGDDGEMYRAEVGRAMAKGGPDHYEFEFRIARPSGEIRWLWTRAKIMRDADGNPVRRAGVCRDITEQKRGEEELRRMGQDLRNAQRLEAVGTLAGGVAHDFNNILGAIVGYGELAQRHARKGTRLRRDLDSIMSAGERGRALVDRILAFSRSGVAERMPVHVEAVVREALDQVAASLPKNIEIKLRLRSNRAAMLGDSTQVHQVVMNLAANAVQAMPNGGALRVSLEVGHPDPAHRTTVGSIAPDEYIVLKIGDTGTGIPEGVLERMFDPFYTTKEVGVGSGLGLSLVHGIVTSVGGAIDVATQVGRGTTFTVYFRRSGDAPEKQADKDRPLPRGSGQRVLVVDDEEPLVRLATETLKSLGYVPVGFTSSAAALAAFSAEPARFEVLLTDERMPGMSGTTLIREVKKMRASIPVILMSGYVGMEAIGADIVLRKPVSARDLAVSIERVLIQT